ncbi:hypothetical protein [Henriciella sp.]|uniref:hypothetical protein n=1 Tax=Henriciella sp. TaxID=1968823 RepID=UPI002621B64C|nr:hypothetical protein [Henriciella sp.]
MEPMTPSTPAHEPKIVTHYDPPPVPWRSFDWCAYDDRTHDMDTPCGYGATEAEAIEDLMEQLDD